MARPRSAKAHAKVLDAAAHLFAERGIDGTSMDAIAESSGVSKATIYKHWPDKDTLCLEVLSYLHGLDDERPVFDSGDYLADLVAELKYQPAVDRKPMLDRIMPHLMAYGSRNQAFGREWRSRALEPRRRAIAAIVKRGEAQGILRRGIDPEVALALLLGPLMYRFLLVSKVGGAGPANLEEHVARTFFAAFRDEHSHTRPTAHRRNPHD